MAIPINEDPYFNPYDDYDSDLDAEPPPPPRYRPPSIDSITKRTKFSRKEIQIIYRAFKQGCPNGTISLEQFQEIFAQFFPRGNAARYAELVFKTFDRDGDLIITFDEFVAGLSTISRGSIHDKLEWIFTLYDVEQRGAIGHSELYRIAEAMYALLGDEVTPPISHAVVLEHARHCIQKLEERRLALSSSESSTTTAAAAAMTMLGEAAAALSEGRISRAHFVALCERDAHICAQLELFDTRI